MSNPPKPAGMDRRKFLQFTGSGLALSMFSMQTVDALAAQGVTFSSDGFLLTLHFAPKGPVELRSLRNPKTGFEWARSGSSFGPIFTTTDKPSQRWTSSPVAGSHQNSNGHSFEFVSQAEDSIISAKTSLRSITNAPILEFQVEFHNAAKPPVTGTTAFGPFRFELRENIGPLRVHAIRRNEYGLESILVKGPLVLSGGKWNAPEYGGLLLLEAVGTGEFLVVGIEWERGWRYSIENEGNRTWLSIEVADLTYEIAPGEHLPAPRVFLGLSNGDLEQAFLDVRHYMQGHIFPAPLQGWPWVVYDFWATEAEGVEEALFHEIDFSAKLGVDVFNMDAAWYLGSSKKGTGDWGCGLGHYTDDRQKYPSGLASISHRVHEAGMKFGLWVGPNVVDSRIVGTLIPKQWIAQVDGKDQTLHPEGWETPVDQVCLGCREYIDFLKTELTRIVRDFHLDWLKWDNSGIPASPAGCNRSDHGHQAGDGSYAALVGQYEIFNHLHATFPDLVLEQCGYGSRLDYGLARTIRSNWLSDASFPSDRVRQNAMVASHIYPSMYNGAWIVSEDPDLLKSTNDPAMLDTIFRSRMISLFGFGTINGQLKERVSLFPEPVLMAARRNTELYKRYRHLLQQDCYQLLPDSGTKKDQWQAIQFVLPSGKEAVVLVFRAESAQEAIQIPLRGLKKDGKYEIEFANEKGANLRKNGDELLSNGVGVSLKHPQMSEVILIRML
jgi:alpha-galactosidase